MNIVPLTAFSDNYIWLLQGEDFMAVVDPGAAGPVMTALEKKSHILDAILLTHHHSDHTGGVRELREKYGAKVYGPAAEKQKMPPLDVFLADGEGFALGGEHFTVIETPGHTLGHICYYAQNSGQNSGVVFTGDTLFSLGCGRVFEGTAAQMFNSLQKLEKLPPNTEVYCGHEYTLSNAAFAQSVVAQSIVAETPFLTARVQQVKTLREQGQPTIPVSLEEEEKTNPFLLAQTVEEFTRLRLAKDRF
ncbi:hydroxyacylglutathione hydrolase [Entomobacter blattae]|uniref:Hydroxyacylglutathione hydrolase n=1 Tax=Entomobacter blattae TaxID=2762277 RepID=A0A7H1NUZ2_9PROT|nr:hydroxyacylglutathione hydrolase [Entomobacter blattae]QNT79602.1 Hydroxyacylglutathione hydrolase GloB [Entomobacter blattae]